MIDWLAVGFAVVFFLAGIWVGGRAVSRSWDRWAQLQAADLRHAAEGLRQGPGDRATVAFHVCADILDRVAGGRR